MRRWRRPLCSPSADCAVIGDCGTGPALVLHCRMSVKAVASRLAPRTPPRASPVPRWRQYPQDHFRDRHQHAAHRRRHSHRTARHRAQSPSARPPFWRSKPLPYTPPHPESLKRPQSPRSRSLNCAGAADEHHQYGFLGNLHAPARFGRVCAMEITLNLALVAEVRVQPDVREISFFWKPHTNCITASV